MNGNLEDFILSFSCNVITLVRGTILRETVALHKNYPPACFVL